MKTLELSTSQMRLLHNILAFRVIAGEPLTRPYDEDIKKEMSDVMDQIDEVMGWR